MQDLAAYHALIARKKGRPMTRRVEIGKRGQALQKRLRGNFILHCEVDQTELGEKHNGRRWFLEPGGRLVGPRTAERLIRKGVVQSRGDGLFLEDAQTYELVQTSRGSLLNAAAAE